MRVRIKEWRLARGLSQGELARLVGVQPEAVCRWERGSREPGALRHVEALCRALGVAVGDLLEVE